MDQPMALQGELARARRLAAQAYDPQVAKLLADYAEELERRLAERDDMRGRCARL